MFNKHLEFQMMNLQKDVEELKKLSAEKDKKIEELERYKLTADKDLESIKDEMSSLEAKFAKKLVETIVFGAIAMIITAFASGLVGASGIGGFL